MSFKAKVGLDAVPLNHLNGGISYYIFYLLDELIQLHPEWQFFLYTFANKGDIKHFTKYPNVIIRALPFLKTSHSLWCQTTLPYGLYKDNIDVFWGTTQSVPLICRKKLKNILLCYDFAFRLFPQTLSSIKCHYLKMCTSWMTRKADCVISISKATANKLLNLYARQTDLHLSPPLKTSIQHREREKTEHFLLDFSLKYKKYFLTVGTLEPRKNFISLVDHYLKLLEKRNELFPLVIVGGVVGKIVRS